MSVARHHNEWLSLVEVSGPFLSLPVLMRVFPQQLDTLDTGLARDARLAFSEWEDAEGDRAIHTAWVEFVLKRVLQFPDAVLLQGQALPAGLEVLIPEHGETLRPSYAIKRPEDVKPALLVASYPPEQNLESGVSGGRWRTAAPSTRMMTLLQGSGVPLGLVTNGADWLLVAARPGEPTTYVTWDAALWSEEPLTLRAFCALLGVKRVYGAAETDSLPAMLVESAQNQQEVTDQLGYQVRKAVEVLVQAVDRINSDRQGKLLEGIGEKQMYDAALNVMMRMVFVFSAEERGLLLLGDPLWDRHYAISTLRDQLREVPDENLLTYRHDAWSRLMATFRVIYAGVEHDQLRLPAYGGALFDPDRFPFLEGRLPGTRWRNAQAQPLPINNRTVLHLLEALQYLNIRLPGGGSEPRRLSFRALDIEQIGHVYEGLLDHTALRATSTVLGLRGSSGDDVEIELATLEIKAAENEVALLDYLKERTGRQTAALRRDLHRGEPPNPLSLHAICAGHDGLYARVAPFSHLLREDSSGQAIVIHTGSVYVTKGSDRRSTGTHYTPRALTEQVVKTTLDPLLYAGVSEGVEPSVETLKSPSDILTLKVCDPACGSGAFLVQACRYMAERVVEGWALAEAQSGPGIVLTIPEALPAGASHSEQLLPSDPEERLALARRLVAERCLYGVDFNPMAVEMAKLSLWLVTLHKHRPFTFLDHAIKCGDSLLGLHDPAQLERFHLVPSRVQSRLVDYLLAEVQGLLAQARSKRESLERFTAMDVRDGELKSRLHRDAEASLTRVRLLADIIVGTALQSATSNANRSHSLLDSLLQERLQKVAEALEPTEAEEQQRMAADTSAQDGLWALTQMAQRVLREPHSGANPRRPFHWLVEFPEVFAVASGGGFDALVGNPPFIGGKKITGLFGTDYRDYLVVYLAEGRRGSADLCAYFFLRAAQVVRLGGNFGLLAVNTIAEGDTRQVGLEALMDQGISLFAARPSFEWPGAAAVAASEVHGYRGVWTGARRLSGETVSTISAYLSSVDEWSPKPLQANMGKSFVGSYVLGMGFMVEPEVAHGYIAKDSRNAEVLFPYLNGEDLNSHHEQQASRWVINFWDWPLDRSVVGATWKSADERQRERWLRDGCVPTDYDGRVAADFPDLLGVLEKKVRPERQRLDEGGSYVLRSPLPQRWWQYADKRPALYHALGRGSAFARHPDGWTLASPSDDTEPHVLVAVQTSKYLSLSLQPRSQVFSHMTVVFPGCTEVQVSALLSSLHAVWVAKYSSSLETRLRYIPTDCFDTFPFPSSQIAPVDIGLKLLSMRKNAMTSSERGLTSFLNQFHSPDVSDEVVVEFRQAQQKLDLAVARAFGWSDLDLEHGFYEVTSLPENDCMRFTISEAARLECLRRLAILNRERWQEEQEAMRSLEAAQAELESPRRRGRKAVASQYTVVTPQVDLF